MNLDSFLIRLVFLGLPGIVGSKLYRKLRGRRDQPAWEHFLEIALFSLLSYATYDYLSPWLPISSKGIEEPYTPLQALLHEDIPVAWISWRQILCPSLIGIALAVTASYFDTYKLVTKLGRWVKATRRFGDEDVWDFFHNMPGVEWVFVRDHELDLVYFGWILAYSDSGKDRELILRDVDVYRNLGDAERLYQCAVLYVSRDKHDLSIEVPLVKGQSS